MDTNELDRLRAFEKQVMEKRSHNIDLMKQYYQDKTKNKVVFCTCCKKEYKKNSWFNHQNSPKHLKNKTKYIL
jgi:hypothetical protein